MSGGFEKHKETQKKINKIFKKYDVSDFTSWLDIVEHKKYLKKEAKKKEKVKKEGGVWLEMRRDKFPSYYEFSDLLVKNSEATWFHWLNIRVVTAIFKHGKEIIKDLEKGGLDSMARYVSDLYDRQHGNKKFDGEDEWLAEQKKSVSVVFEFIKNFPDE